MTAAIPAGIRAALSGARTSSSPVPALYGPGWDSWSG